MKLYLSKIKDTRCPQYFRWKHIEKLSVPVKNEKMEHGLAVHEALSVYLKQGIDKAIEYCELNQYQIKDQLLAVVNKLNEEGLKKVVASEKTIRANLEGFEGWFIKPDFLFIDKNNRLWIGELKTTSSNNISRLLTYYLKSHQLSTYFYFSKLRLPKLFGVKLFLVNKGTKNSPPAVFVETVYRDSFDEKLTVQFINWAINRVKGIVNQTDTIQMLECFTFFGECPYWNLCYTKWFKPSMLEDAKTFYVNEDPDKHLEI